MNKLNILVAYPYMKREVVETINANQDKIRFLLDSGAFTAWKAGKPIQLDDYCRFIESLPFKPWRYFTLDVIGDAEKSFNNYQIMLKRGFNPIPIFTRGEDISMIDEYYKTSDVLGIGGLVGTQGNKGFVKAIMSKIGNRKVHWLGFTNLTFVSFYKPYMCDSSSWSGGIRFGQMPLYLGSGKWLRLRKESFLNKPDKNIIDTISKFGFDCAKLSKKSEWHNAGSTLLNHIPINSWIRYSFDVENKFNTKQFLAIGTKRDLLLFIENYKRIKV